MTQDGDVEANPGPIEEQNKSIHGICLPPGFIRREDNYVCTEGTDNPIFGIDGCLHAIDCSLLSPTNAMCHDHLDKVSHLLAKMETDAIWVSVNNPDPKNAAAVSHKDSAKPGISVSVSPKICHCAIQASTNVLGMSLAPGFIRKSDDYVYYKTEPSRRVCGVNGCLTPTTPNSLPQEAFCPGHSGNVISHLGDLVKNLRNPMQESPQILNWERPYRDAKLVQKPQTPTITGKSGQASSISPSLGVTMSPPVVSSPKPAASGTAKKKGSIECQTPRSVTFVDKTQFPSLHESKAASTAGKGKGRAKPSMPSYGKRSAKTPG